MPRFETVLLDLDGTLVDSAPGIVSTIAHTLRELGVTPPPMSELLHWVGPPLPESFQHKLGFTPSQTEQAIQIYRERYLEIGAYDSRLFDGVGALLRDLKADGRRLALATSKPWTPAVLMLEHFTLVPYFDVIATAADDESRGAKHEVIEDALAGLAELGADSSNLVMVGDRIHDVEGARMHNIPSALVRWGYGAADEWAEADHLIDTPRQLREFLGLAAPRLGVTS